jgi:hypothetical protein
MGIDREIPIASMEREQLSNRGDFRGTNPSRQRGNGQKENRY